MRVAVIGAGSWGTAVAWLLDQKGHEVSMWAREEEIAQAITKDHHNPTYLPDVKFSERVTASSHMEEVLKNVEAAVMVTPSIGVRSTAELMKPFIKAETPIVILSKGVEGHTSMLMTDVLEDVLGNPERIAGLSGPNHAEEVSRGIPSATVVASRNYATAAFFQELFTTNFFRVYTNDDVVGVEMCGAGKNIVAIACGMVDGLGMGDNTKASLMTRGLAELARLGEVMGANPLTYMGLAGMGDLIATCTSKHSRNRALGELIAQGGTLEEFEAKTKMVAEGAVACKTIHELAQKKGIELPLTEVVYKILYEGHSPREAAEYLMERPTRKEHS